jgi:hypothetical protein
MKRQKRMVYCKTHYVYLHGRKEKKAHIDKYKCFYIERKTQVICNIKLKKFNNRNPINKISPTHREKYIWKRNRRGRSKYRTERKQQKWRGR